MELRRPAAYGYQQCPHRGPGSPGSQRLSGVAVPGSPGSQRLSGVAGRQGVPPARTQTQARPPAAPARSATAASLSQPKPAAPAAAPPHVPAQPKRAWLSAYAKDFTVTVDQGEHMRALPLEPQRAEGGMGVSDGRTAAPEDGYYMLLWELGVDGAQGEATLQLGINEAASQLTYALHPGYDNGQQVTWLGRGDKVGLLLRAGDGEKAEVRCTSAQFTVIRLG